MRWFGEALLVWFGAALLVPAFLLVGWINGSGHWPGSRQWSTSILETVVRSGGPFAGMGAGSLRYQWYEEDFTRFLADVDNPAVYP